MIFYFLGGKRMSKNFFKPEIRTQDHKFGGFWFATLIFWMIFSHFRASAGPHLKFDLKFELSTSNLVGFGVLH